MNFLTDSEYEIGRHYTYNSKNYYATIANNGGIVAGAINSYYCCLISIIIVVVVVVIIVAVVVIIIIIIRRWFVWLWIFRFLRFLWSLWVFTGINSKSILK